MVRTVKAEIAAVDHEIRSGGIDVFADPMKILGKGRVVGG